MKTPAAVVVCALVSPLLAGNAVEDIAKPIERAHDKQARESKQAVRCDITIHRGGRKLLAARTLFETGRERVRLEAADGSWTAVWDGHTAWV